jgi:hypothetical protein
MVVLQLSDARVERGASSSGADNAILIRASAGGSFSVTVVQAYTRFMVVFFIMVGLGCLIKPLTDAPGGGLILWPEAGRTFGIFLINWVHTVLHLGLAVYAALAVSRTSAARGFGQTVFWVCAVLVVIGLVTPDGVWLLPANWGPDVVRLWLPAGWPSALGILAHVTGDRVTW